MRLMKFLFVIPIPMKQYSKVFVYERNCFGSSIKFIVQRLCMCACSVVSDS